MKSFLIFAFLWHLSKVKMKPHNYHSLVNLKWDKPQVDTLLYVRHEPKKLGNHWFILYPVFMFFICASFFNAKSWSEKLTAKVRHMQWHTSIKQQMEMEGIYLNRPTGPTSTSKRYWSTLFTYFLSTAGKIILDIAGSNNWKEQSCYCRAASVPSVSRICFTWLGLQNMYV